MNNKRAGSIAPASIILLLAILACTLGQAAPPTKATPPPLQPTYQAPAQVAASVTAAIINESSTQPATATPPVDHQMRPADLAPVGKVVYDVESDGTAPEKRAPYGDSYDINRFERPFLQDMTYNPNLDISTFSVGQDKAWYYVSIALVGNDPNDKLGIDYGVELDTDHDGFGDFLIWARPPYPIGWDTAPIQIWHDTNHDTGGLSAEKSDAPLAGNGYDTLVFGGGAGDLDPDIAWIRINAGLEGLVQFAFKRSWSKDVFMLGVIADAGWKTPGKMDYVDRITLADAGSPIRDNRNYPLKALFAVDNVCRAAYGFKPTGNEPQLCPQSEPPPNRTPKPGVTLPPPSACLYACLPGLLQRPYPDCTCH